MYGVVYQIVNRANGKRYIGQSIDPFARLRSHFGSTASRSSPILHKAVRKYGKENFEFCIIDTAEDKKELDGKEIFWIARLNTMQPYGYNLREGGAGGGALSEDSKRKISKANKGRLVGENNPCYGLTGPKHPMYGKPGPNRGRVLSDEQKMRISRGIAGIRRSLETKEKIRSSALNRWKSVRDKHLLEKGHKYDLVRLANGSIRCRVCKNENERRRYREIQRANVKKKAKALRR